VLLSLTVGPFQEKIVAEKIPVLKHRAAISIEANAAIEALVGDVRRTGSTPVILTSRWVSASRIALRLGTGKDTFLVERLVSRKRLGEPSLLPPLGGRTVYLCLPLRERRDVAQYLQRLERQAVRKEIIYKTARLVILKWTF
jgi:hypothetical protein